MVNIYQYLVKFEVLGNGTPQLFYVVFQSGKWNIFVLLFFAFSVSITIKSASVAWFLICHSMMGDLYILV